MPVFYLWLMPLFIFISSVANASLLSECIFRAMSSANRSLTFRSGSRPKINLPQQASQEVFYSQMLELAEHLKKDQESSFYLLKVLIGPRENRLKHADLLRQLIQESALDPARRSQLALVLNDSSRDFSDHSNKFNFTKFTPGRDATTLKREGLLTTLRRDPSKSPFDFLDQTILQLSAARDLFPVRSKVLGAAKKLREILFDNASIEYQRGLDIDRSNEGIAGYLAKELQQDPVLLKDAVLFYSKLMVKDRQIASREPTLFDKADLDVWALALESAGGDPYRALRAVAIFGHDNVAERLCTSVKGKSVPLLELLIRLAPNFKSQLYKPGSLPGTELSPKTLSEFKVLSDQYEKLYAGTPIAYYLEAFRAANYHVLGSAFLSAELVHAGYGRVGIFKLPVIIGETMGFAYKRHTMESNYINGDAKVLASFEKTQPSGLGKRPEGWSEERYKKAKLDLEINRAYLDLTAEQHRIGASWAYDRLVP